MDAEDAIPSTVEGRRLETPARETLLRHYAGTEFFSKATVAFECVVIFSLGAWLLAHTERIAGPVPWVALALGGVGVFRWFLHHVFLNKKRLEDIRPDARFGVHSRDSLVALARGVFDRLGVRPGSAPVFITRDKDVNAQAVRCELWPGQHLFNGVFLNRSILHLLDEAELASVIGHELGHVRPYAPLLSRCYVIHSAFAGLVSLWLATLFPAPGVALIAPFGVLWILDRAIYFPHSRISRGVEFLCDDFGAQAAGLLPALSGEFKIATEVETRQQLMRRFLEAREQGSTVQLSDLAEAYEQAVPFGKADPENFQRQFQKIVSEKQSASGGISLRGFLGHLGGGDSADADEWARDQAARLKALAQLPVIDLPRSDFLEGSRAWTMHAAGTLAEAIERAPERLLFQFAEEIDDRSASHPNASRRILFLWRNRKHYPERV